ncbi:MAG: ParB/RepB/Spo0J family partition protein [Clostridiales bacterium]|nr:ParB/RepB/Spo0J family partition protein [Clostridiales bacterium]
MDKKKGLGRGLESLFAVYEDIDNENITKQKLKTEEDKRQTAATKDGVTELDINKIYPNPNQPRKHFDEEALQELASSIKLHGVIQPLVVNKAEDGNYMIIAGERRWRASNLAGLEKVPVVIKNYTEKQVKEIAIIENLQREDLNPIEAARAIKQLMEEYNLTQEVVSDRIGKSRSSVANTLRLLSLYPDVITMIENGRLSSGHARSLVVIDDTTQQIKLAKQAADGKMSVRDLEKAVKNYLNPTKTASAKPQEQSLELKELINEMQRVFSTKVSAIGNDNKGRIYIDYYSREDLDRLSDMIDLIKKKELTLADLRNYNKRHKEN